MIPDKLLINLKILGKIQKNGRIARSHDGIISIENDYIYQSIKRFFFNDSRRQAVYEINSIITELTDTFTNIIHSKFMNKNYHMTEEYIQNCQLLSLLADELDSARVGVCNLRFTYQNDCNISSQLDIALLKIDTLSKSMRSKLAHFQPLTAVSINMNVTDDTNELSFQSKV